mgnify:CR=1 FL=1
MPRPNSKVLFCIVNPEGLPGNEQGPKAMFKVNSLELIEFPKVTRSFNLYPSLAAFPRI